MQEAPINFPHSDFFECENFVQIRNPGLIKLFLDYNSYLANSITLELAIKSENTETVQLILETDTDLAVSENFVYALNKQNLEIIKLFDTINPNLIEEELYKLKPLIVSTLEYNIIHKNLSLEIIEFLL